MLKTFYAVVFALCATVANAGNIEYIFTAVDGQTNTYDVAVRVTGADTSGLAGFGFNITGYGEAGAAATQFTPVALQTFSSSFQTRGFGLTTTNGVVGTGATAYRSIGNTQFNTGPTQPIYGIGISAQSVTGFSGGGFPNLSFGVPAVLGRLVTPGALTLANIATGGTLFTTAQTHNLVLATNTSSASFGGVIPEPSTVALAALSIVGLVGLARRRS